MSAADHFLDTNVLLYLLSRDEGKATTVEDLIARGATVSVQVFNEFANVATRKLRMSLAEVRDVLGTLAQTLTVLPLTLGIHHSGMKIAARYGFSIYDAMIVAAALEAGCTMLLTEDLQHGQRLEAKLLVSNPFCP